MSILPNFLIIGTAKAGTTAIFAALKQHPQIFMCPIKEPRFFAFEDDPPWFGGPTYHDYVQHPTITRLENYQALFANAGAAKARGEASTIYTYYPGDKPAARIRQYLPDVRLIVLLRQPAARTYANFVHAVRNDWEPLDDFGRALADEPRRVRENWSYFLRYRLNSDYLTQLGRYYARFNRCQIRVYLYDDLCADPLALMQDMFRFLEVDHSFVPDLSRRQNISLLPHSFRLHRLLSRLRRVAPWPGLTKIVSRLIRLNLYPPALPAETRQTLTAAFRLDILQLQELIDRDLTYWLDD